MTLKALPWWPMEGCKMFEIWKMTRMLREKSWKYILLWSAFLVDNVLGIKIQLLQWIWVIETKKMEDWALELNWRLTSHYRITAIKKCLEKTLIFIYFFWRTFWTLDCLKIAFFLSFVLLKNIRFASCTRKLL